MTAEQTVTSSRTGAIWRLFDEKFNADYRITIGSATCEHAAGSLEVYDHLAGLIANAKGRKVTIGKVGCAGRCDMEPVVTVIGKGSVAVKYVNVTPEKAEQIFNRHIMNDEVVEEHCMRHVEGWAGVRRIAAVCGGEGCDPALSAGLAEQLLAALQRHNLANAVSVTRSDFAGASNGRPALHIYPDNVVYRDPGPEAIERIAIEHLRDGRIVADLAHKRTGVTDRSVPFFGDVHFFGKQLRMTLRNCGVIDPESIDEYLAVRGYQAAARMIDTLSPKEVRERIAKTGLRGRGGGGFAPSAKWDLAASQVADVKYLICNADEGDPGAFMDRSTIEGDPHTVIEGMIIAGYAIGATRGFVYTRVEYPLAVERLERAITQAREKGFLGKGVFGTDWDFDIEVRLGAGAFVCGEETALIKSIEGHRGEPEQRPPYPTEAGLWGKPTVINNVETLANLPVALLDGAEWFASIGVGKSRGTKVFALAGKVRHTGLIEVPMGTTLREIIFDIGGGIPDGRRFKAVQTGGPAGGCLPENLLDTSIDYESLGAAGSIMGSGGMIVMDDTTCMVDIARYFLEFMVEESCGKCTPCRAGTRIMLGLLKKIAAGKAAMEDLTVLESLAGVISRSALCGLGKCSPNPVASTLRYFRNEYVEHIVEKRCAAGACRNMVTYTIDPVECVGCRACARKCPVPCIHGERREPHEIVQELCIKCGRCLEVCRFGAVKKR